MVENIDARGRASRIKIVVFCFFLPPLLFGFRHLHRRRQERWTGDAAGSSAQRAGRLLWDIRAENQQRSEEFLLGRFQPPGLPQLFLLAVVPIIRAVGASLNLELKL